MKKLYFQNREQNITRGQFFRFSGHEACIEIYAFPSSEDGLLASPFIILMRSRSVSLKFEPFTTRVFPPSASQTTRDYSSQFSFKMNSSSRNHGRIQKFFFKGDFLLTFWATKGENPPFDSFRSSQWFQRAFQIYSHNVWNLWKSRICMPFMGLQMTVFFCLIIKFGTWPNLLDLVTRAFNGQNHICVITQGWMKS